VDTFGRHSSQKSANREGNIFFLARSPDAPTTMIVTVDSSPLAFAPDNSTFPSEDIIGNPPLPTFVKGFSSVEVAELAVAAKTNNNYPFQNINRNVTFHISLTVRL